MKYDMQSKKKNGSKFVIIRDEVERKTGFARGSVMSAVIHDLKVLKERQPDAMVAIQNTTEDLDFYSHILKKLPDVYFVFDRDYATKYSVYPIDKWLEFKETHNSISL